MKKHSYLEKYRTNNTFEDYSKKLLDIIAEMRELKYKEIEENDKSDKKALQNFIENKFLREGDKLLSLQVVGSFLHGTDTINSDYDFKGIFIPSKKSLLLKEKRQSYKFSSTKNAHKNGNKDIDITFYSLHFVLEKLAQGDFNFLELIFALREKNNCVYRSKRAKCLYNNRFKFFDKEGLRHSLLGFIKNHYLNINDKIVARETYDKSDLKRLAHAYRALIMLQEVLNTKNILFPLKGAEFIRNIKENKIDIFRAIERIEKRLPVLKKEINKSSFILEEVNKKDIETMILSFYWKGDYNE